jgi:hypothetical protein
VRDYLSFLYTPFYAIAIMKDLTALIPRIASGAYYESHQQLRVIAARYLKQSNYDAAADILAGGAKALLRAGFQQGASASGGDLAIMLVVEVYNKAEWEISDDNDAVSRARKSESSASSYWDWKSSWLSH